MSINITFAGNLLNPRPRRTLLSDAEQIKKSERDRRKRLRLEQVRQQSKERASQILERTKQAEQQEIEKLQNDKDSELRLLLQNMRQKYSEDMENIGQAHLSASKQPNVDKILEENHKRNRIIAAERGRAATRRLRETNKKEESQRNASKNRRKNIRESENLRASMVSQLSKTATNYNDDSSSTLSENSENVPNQKNIINTTAVVHKEDDDTSCLKQFSKKSKRSKATKNLVVSGPDIPHTVITCESDDQHPRRTIPVINLCTSKADKIASYNPEDYRQRTSEESVSISSSNSQDSSESTIIKEPQQTTRTQKMYSTTKSSQVHMYDLNKRKENQYIMPSSTVEKINASNEPNAIDQAKQVTRAESYITKLNEIRKSIAENRGKDAISREKVRRDYDQLLRNLDHYCSEERKLKASQVQNSPMSNVHMNPNRKKKCLKKRQEKIERNIESIMRAQQQTPINPEEIRLPPERVITGSRISEEIPSTFRSTLPNVTAPVINSKKPTINQTLHYEQVLEQLKRLERIKYQLLLEYGSSLPESIFSVAQRPLLQEQLRTNLANGTTHEVKIHNKQDESEPVAPEVRVINVSLENEEKKKKKKKEKEKEKIVPQLSEIAVQTSLTLQNDDAQDKSVQVEMSRDREELSREVERSERRHVLEPTVEVIAETENINSGSSVSSIRDVVIDMNKQQVYVTPQKKNKRPRLTVVARKSLASRHARKGTQKPTRSFSKTTLSSVKETVDKATSPRIESDNEKKDTIESSYNSTEMSHAYSTTRMSPKEGAPYLIQAKQTRRVVKISQTSDSSTSYASPPVIKAGTFLPTANTSTPVLEILDSSRSGIEKIRKSKAFSALSPVSSPETPSPRTMKLASNIPRPSNVRKAFLKHNKRGERLQTNDSQNSKLIAHCKTTNAPSTSKKCSCTNASCRLYHNKPLYDDINSDENNTNIEELQNKIKGKIASVQELLDRLRSMDLMLLLTDSMSPDTTSVNFQIAQTLIKKIEDYNDILVKNLKVSQKLINNENELSTIGPVASTPKIASKMQGDDYAFDFSAFTKPKIIMSDKHVLIDQTDQEQLNDKDETVMRLSTEILKQSENNEKPTTLESDDSSDKQFQMLSKFNNNNQTQRHEEIRLMTTSNGKNYLGRKYNELSTIKEFDTPDTIGTVPPGSLSMFKIAQSSSIKKLSSSRTSTPTKILPEKKSIPDITKSSKLSENSDFSVRDHEDDLSSNPTSSDNNKRTSSELSGFSGVSEISKADSQTSIEKQMYEKVSWAGATVKKTRESAALDSSSTSDAIPINVPQRHLPKKHIERHSYHDFLGFTDISSISLISANKSTEKSVLQKARTSTPNIQTSDTTDCSDRVTTPSMELT